MTPSLVITGLAFIVAGVLHFVIPKVYLSIMPRYLPSPLTLVYVSGVFEILGGAGLLLPATRTAAAVGLILLLLAVFPANIEMLRLAQARGASAPFIAACWLRLPLQLLLIWWVWRVAHASPQ
ncbi:MAG TPA: DoxX family protein [Gemmatimonadaceae bacterium]|nr:DoxX family protein [Gemmatimonadaceae bacterium]